MPSKTLLLNLSALLLLSCGGGDGASPARSARAQAQAAAATRTESETGIAFPPRSHPYGRSMVDWSESWWQFIYAIPAAQNPELDSTGADCAIGQQGDVWVLASVIDPGGVASFSRACTLPAGKALLVSPSGVLNDYPCPDPTFQPAPGQSLYDFLLAGAKPIVDSVNGLSIVLDGTALANPFAYRFTSPDLFNVKGDLSLQSGFDGCITGSPQPAVSDGYFAMLKPLGEGRHTLVIQASDTHGTNVTLTWTLNVVGR